MDIFKPNKNAITIVQHGLPKEINKHIAEYWGFKKCRQCKNHSWYTHFRHMYSEDRLTFVTTNRCFGCTNLPKKWAKDLRDSRGISKMSYEGYLFTKAAKLPSFIKFECYPKEVNPNDYRGIIKGIIDWINMCGVPDEFMDYDSILEEYDNALSNCTLWNVSIIYLQ